MLGHIAGRRTLVAKILEELGLLGNAVVTVVNKLFAILVELLDAVGGVFVRVAISEAARRLGLTLQFERFDAILADHRDELDVKLVLFAASPLVLL